MCVCVCVRLCTHRLYDEYMNWQHLSEVLAIVVSNEGRKEGQNNNDDEDNDNEKCLYFSIFVLFNLNNLNELASALKRYKKLRSANCVFVRIFDKLFTIILIYQKIKINRHRAPLSDCIRMSNAYMEKNYIKMLRLYKKLPLICQLAFHRRLPSIQTYEKHYL
jgi:hypothetical protein